jgi:type II secretory pathway component PulM
MSKREEIRKKRQQETRNQQMLMIGAVVVAAVLIAAIFIVPNLMATNPANYALADGRALGPRDAKVKIEEFSDFQ